MSTQATSLAERIASGKPILLAEISPPRGVDPTPLREAARCFAKKVHAVGISDNREQVLMSALAAAALVAAEGVEPILHVTTRDRNRIALVSEALGAQALGIRNLLCTSGTHQTLGRFRAAKNVYDIASIPDLCRFGGRLSAGGRGARHRGGWPVLSGGGGGAVCGSAGTADHPADQENACRRQAIGDAARL